MWGGEGLVEVGGDDWGGDGTWGGRGGVELVIVFIGSL